MCLSSDLLGNFPRAWALRHLVKTSSDNCLQNIQQLFDWHISHQQVGFVYTSLRSTQATMEKIQPDFSVLRLSSSGKRDFISGTVTSPDLLALTSWAMLKWPCRTAWKYSLRRFSAALIWSRTSRRQRKLLFILFLQATSAIWTEHVFAASFSHTF